MLFVIWVFSVAHATPLAVAITTRTVSLNVRENGQITVRDVEFIFMNIDLDEFKVYYMIGFVGLHILPFVSLGILYARIAWRLRHPDKKLTEPEEEAANQTVSSMAERNRRKTTVMVIAVLLVFFICFFPLHFYEACT